MKYGKAFAFLALLVSPLFIAAQCTPQRTLEPTGPYSGDTIAWAADNLIVDIGDAIVMVDQLVERNPVVLQNEEIKRLFDKLHSQRDGVIERNEDGTIKSSEVYAILIAARRAYGEARTAANEADLQSKTQLARALLGEIKTLSTLIITQK